MLLFPKGKYVEAATDSILKVEDKYWERAVAENQPQGFWNYLDIFPNGKHKKQARERINKIGDDKYWTQTLQANMVEVFEKYLEEFPNGHHRAKAQAKIDSIQNKQAQINQDNLDFEAATKINTIAAFKEYLASHPTGQHLDIAQTNIKALEAKKNCGCPPRTFKTMSHHTFAKFKLPKANGGAVVKIPGGVYNKYVFPKCNRVWWTNLMFMCDPSACAWRRVSGNWDADALCHGSTPKHKYLTVGSF